MQRNLYLDHRIVTPDVTEDDGVRGLEGELHHGGEVLRVAAARVLEVQRHASPAHLELCREGYRVFSKGRNSPTPSKSLIFWTFPHVLGFFYHSIWAIFILVLLGHIIEKIC